MTVRRLLFIIFLLLSILTAPSLTTTAQDPDSTPYRVLYLTASANNSFEIWSMNSDGSDQTYETLFDDYPPLPSADGRYIADYACVSSDFCLSFNIIDLDTNTTQTITIGEKVTGITWSNSGHQLLIRTVIYNEDGYTFTNNMFVLNPDGSNRIDLVTEKLIPTAALWSPDDTNILFFARDEFGADDVLYLASPDGSQMRPLIGIPPCFICDSPRWSPDGETIYFSQYPDLYRLPVECIADENGCEGRAEPLTHFTADYNAIDVAHSRYGQPSYSFSPDGDFLIFTFGYRYDNHRIDIGKMSLTADGWEHRVTLHSQSANMGGATLSPDGQHVFFSSEGDNGQYALFRMTIDGQEVTQLVYGTLQGFRTTDD